MEGAPRSPFPKDMEVKKRNRFILLTRHTDQELTHFLQKEAEKGWWLEKNSGNRFTFVEKNCEGKKICAYTFFSRGPESSTEVQLGRELPYLRKKGWDQICVSKVENIFDSRRHAFLYMEKPTSFFPITEEDEIRKAEKRGWRKALSNLILSLIYLLGALALLLFEKVRLLTSLPYLAVYTVFLLLLLLSIWLSIKSFLWALRRRRNKDEETEKGSYRALDYSTLSLSLMLFFLLTVLLVSSIWGKSGSVGERVNINGESIILYSDNLPLSLEDTFGETKGAYRTKKLEERDSFLASYIHAYDQSFGGDEEGLEYISYSLFTSKFPFVRKICEKEIFSASSISDPALAEKIEVERVEKSSSSNIYLIKDGFSVLCIESSREMEEEDLKKFAALMK